MADIPELLKQLKDLPKIDLPEIKYVGKPKQSLQEWHAAGGSVPVRYKDKPHVWHAKVKKFAEGGPVGGETYGNAPDMSDSGMVQDARHFAHGGAVHMKKGGDPRGEMRATPRNKLLGAAADVTNFLHQSVSEPFGYKNPPVEMISELLGVPAVGRTLNRMSYGEPLTTAGKANVPLLHEDTADAAMSVGPFAPAAARLATKGAKAAGRGALRVAEKGMENLNAPVDPMFMGAAGRQRGVVKPTGGNFLTGRVERDLKPLRQTTGSGMDPDEALAQMSKTYPAGSISSEVERQHAPMIQRLKTDSAVNKWIDGNLANYVKKQMGTPNDPVRALAEEGITHKRTFDPATQYQSFQDERIAAGFPGQGMGKSPAAQAWEQASDEAISAHRAGDIQEMPEKYQKYYDAQTKMVNARENLDSKFLKSVENLNISNNEKAELVRGMTYAEKAKMVGDTEFIKANAEYRAAHNPMMDSYIKLGADNPFISKLDPETKLYAPFTSNLGFDHIIDVLKQDVASGRIRPDQLNKVSMEQAVRRTHEFDEDMAKKMRETQAKITEGMPVHKEYPEGYKWIELTQPKVDPKKELPTGYSLRKDERKIVKNEPWHVVDPNGAIVSGDKGLFFANPEDAIANTHKSESYGALSKALSYEGDTMGHCVGGYCPDVVEGRSRIYSLRDAKGEPHVTVEVQPNRYGPKWEEAVKFREQATEQAKKLPNGYTDKDVADIATQMAKDAMPPSITQIKGKQNRAPKEEYLPYVQDFVKGGNWSDIIDAKNAGLRRYGDVFNVNEQRLIEQTGELVPNHEYLSGEEIQRLHNAINPEGSRMKYDLKGNIVDDGMAHGGVVHMGKGGVVRVGINIAEAVAKASKKADEILDAQKAVSQKGALSKVRNESKAADEAMEAKRLAFETANPPIKASEAYGQHEGAYLKPIFYDRMKVDLSKRKFGGPGFSGIQLVDPNYANAAAGVTDQKMAARILNRNEALVPKGAKVIWTPSVGGLEQHKSNSTMFGEFAEIFANQRKNMSPEEIQKLSDKASNTVDNKGRLIFPNGIDLGSRNFRQKVQTYPQRALMADIFAGRNVGGEKGRTVPVEELLKKNLDPNMAGAGTLDLGNRLFRLEGNVMDRPDLHSDYRKILTGEDLNVNYLPVPIRDVYSEWEAQKLIDLAAQGKNRPVTQMDYTKNDPTVQLTDKLLTELQKRGYKEGGAVEKHFDGGGMAAADFAGAEDDGGSFEKAKLMAKILADMAKQQGSKEVGSLSKPRATTDLLNRGVIANNPLSAIVDMVNMGLIPLDILGSKLTGRDIKVSSDKPFLGSEHVKDMMDKYGATSGEERPMMETALSFASPTGMIKGAQKTAELAKRAPEALSNVRGGLETMSANAQRPFRSATLTMEGVAPDLGQKGGDKFKDLVTKRMISGEGAPVGMERMGGRKTEKTMGQGLYENFAGQQETNPMVGVTIPRAGNLSTNKQLIADIGTAGRELGQEMVAAHKFTPLMFKNPKDATAMMIGGSERLTKNQIQNIADALPGMIVTHSPKNNSMFVAPFEGDALDYKKASQAASEILGKGAKVQFGKADSNKDIMFRGDYDKMGARPPSAESIEMRNRLKKAEERIVRGPSVSQSGRQSQPSTLASTVR